MIDITDIMISEYNDDDMVSAYLLSDDTIRINKKDNKIVFYRFHNDSLTYYTNNTFSDNDSLHLNRFKRVLRECKLNKIGI